MAGYKSYFAAGALFLTAVVKAIEGDYATAFALAAEALAVFGLRAAIAKGK